MPEFLYKIQPTRPEMLIGGPTEQEASIIEEHFHYLENLVIEGVVLMAGRTLTADDQSFGIVIFRAGSESEANQIVQGDPVVSQGVMSADLFPYRIALWSANGPKSSL